MSPIASLPIASTPAGTFDLDSRDFPDRDSLISFLALRCGWKSPAIARVMGMSDRHARRIARLAPAWRPTPRRDDEPLTPAEIEAIARDYQGDPYLPTEDREFAQEWIEAQCKAAGMKPCSIAPGKRRINRTPKPAGRA